MSAFTPAMLQHAETVLQQLRDQKLTLATVESCTGGLLSALLTEIPGSSDVFTHGFVTYANEAKQSMVGVSPSLIAQHGAVSEPVARAMAEGGLHAARASVAVAITGIAGPGGATADKQVGLVHIAVARDHAETIHAVHQFDGDRAAVRVQAVTAALGLLLR